METLLVKLLNKFEKIKKLLNPKFVVGVANGSDALELALRYYNFKPNSEVITVFEHLCIYSKCYCK